MSTRHRSRNCKNCGDLPIQLFTPELRSECRACYNSKRRQQNSLGSQQLKHGTWIETSQLFDLYGQIEALQSQISTLTTDRSVVDQELRAEIQAKEQGLIHNQQLGEEIQSLRAQILALTTERPLIDQLDDQISETTQRLITLETLLRDTHTRITDLQGLISHQSKEIPTREEISIQLSTLSHLIPDRSLIDQLKTQMAEQFTAFQIHREVTLQSSEIYRLEELLKAKEAQLSERSVIDQLEHKIEDQLLAQETQLAELLSQLKLQRDQISSLILDRPVVDQGPVDPRYLTPPRRASLPEAPISAEPSAVTVHPSPLIPSPSSVTVQISERRVSSSTMLGPPRYAGSPQGQFHKNEMTVVRGANTPYMGSHQGPLGPVIAQKMHQLQEHGLPLSTPPRVLPTPSAKKFPVIKQPVSIKK